MEQKRQYYECKNVEKALQRHIQDAIEDKYLEAMVNEDTQLIHEDIPMVLAYLFETYGKIPSEEVKQKEADICALIFHPADPMILLYNPIEKLRNMGESALIPYSENQLLDIGLTVLRNTRDFERALGDWEALPLDQKTWLKFKQHFMAAQQQLKAIRGPMMQQAGYHHVNHLAAQLCKDLEDRHQEFLSVIQTLDPSSVAPTAAETQITSISDIMSPTQCINATTTDMVQFEMLKLLRQMQQSMNNMPQTLAPAPATRLAPAPAPKRRINRKTRDNANFPRRTTNQYCWTHGGCAHGSKDCSAPALGHWKEATFENRMGGSNAYCS